MSEQPAVSVIVPVYKAESYLSRCVDSLLAQTFPDFEILLIDDGSPDRSGEICDAYAEKDSRVRVFHKENGGVSSARQCGIDNARGEYTIHADPDDWVEPDMLEALYKKAKEEDADMVICDYYEEYADKRIYRRQQPSEMNPFAVINDLLFQRLHGSLWNKLVKRVCYRQYGIRLLEGLDLCEDLALNIRLLKNPIKISYQPKAFYHYDQCCNDQSMTHMYTLKSCAQRKLLVSYLKPYLEDHILRCGYENIFTLVAIEDFVCGFSLAPEFKRAYFKEKRVLLRRSPWRWKVFLCLAAIGFLDEMRWAYKVLKMLVANKSEVNN